jgi:chorismate synthase
MAICAALCDGVSVISNPLVSDDIKATVHALQLLGAKIRQFDKETLEIAGPISAKDGLIIDCRESGSTLRFMLPIAAATGGKSKFIGSGRLPNRKIKDLLDALRKLGAKIDSDSLPLTISGKIHGGKIKIPGDISSQFISGLLFAFSLLEQDSVIELTTQLQSRPYVDLTIETLGRFGITVHHDKDYKRFEIEGSQRFIPSKQSVEGDYSSTSFMLAAAALCGDMHLSGLIFPSKQGDSKVVGILQSMGAKFRKEKEGLTIKKSPLKAVDIDAKDIPDAVPILAVVASQAQGKTRIYNAERLRDKESDRLAAITKELNKMGASIVEKPDGLEINGPIALQGASIDPHGDHRIAMAASVAGLVADGDTEITNPECVKKSYPDFFKDLAALGAQVMPSTNMFGKKLQISVYGSSHGKRIGVKIIGVPEGIRIEKQFIQSELEKRKSKGSLSTPRREKDQVKILQGIENNITTGKEIMMEIENKEVRSKDYAKITNTPRPGHADYTAFMKYSEIVDMRGGGFFSGRMTACFVMAGAVAKKMLKQQGIHVNASIKQIGRAKDEREMKNEILEAKEKGDSVGGIIECSVSGVLAGLGEPLFDSVESCLSHAMFSIPAVKGIEFGSGFKGALTRGSKNNDEFALENEKLITITNNSGGILGGISNGMPIVFRVAIKPTSSISKEQKTIDLKTMKETTIRIEGRHDPCIVVRAPVVVESMTALALADLYLRWENE